MLILVPLVYPPLVGLLTGLHGWESDIADDDASMLSQVMVGQTPEQADLLCQVELVQDVGQHDAVEPPKFSGPTAQ